VAIKEEYLGTVWWWLELDRWRSDWGKDSHPELSSVFNTYFKKEQEGE